jgi:hypothetical protein
MDGFDGGRQLRTAILLGLSAFVMSTLAPKVAYAYMIRMHGPQVRPPTGDIGSAQTTKPQPAPDSNASVPLNISFIAHVAESAMSTPSRALWVMYPAAVRGRTFGGTGADPLSPTSSGGW